MKNEKLEDYICVIKHALSDDLCNKILEEYKNTYEWKATLVGSGDIKTDIRNCQKISISDQNTIKKNIEVRSNLDQLIFNQASLCITDYNKQFSCCKIKQDSGYELLRYSENCFYKQHVDSFKEHPRSVSCSFALNDNFEGGEFAFFDRELKYKLEKGDALMFPSNFMYPHEVMPVTKGTRYSIVTWFI